MIRSAQFAAIVLGLILLASLCADLVPAMSYAHWLTPQQEQAA